MKMNIFYLTMLLAWIVVSPVWAAGPDGVGSEAAHSYAGVSVEPGSRGQLEPRPTPEDFIPWDTEWKLFGPVFTEKDTGNFSPWYEGREKPLALDGAETIPDSIMLDGYDEPAKPIKTGELIDFQQLYFMNAGQGMAYLLREETVERDGLLHVKCFAVGWLKVWVNGNLVHQDGSNEYDGMMHEMALPMRRGRNLICLRLAGATGGYMVENAGFWTKNWKEYEDMSIGSWWMQLWRAPEMLDFRPTIERQLTWNDQQWQVSGFAELDVTAADALTVASYSWKSARAEMIEPTEKSADRIYEYDLLVRAVSESDSEFFMQVKEGVEIGFMCHYAPEKGRYEVIWQVRRDGLPVWEGERLVMKDWMPDFLPIEVPQFTLSQELGEFSAVPVLDRENTRMRVIVSLRGDELIMWVDKMQLSIRTQVEGMAGREGAPAFHARGIKAEITNFVVKPLPEDLKNRLALTDNPPVRWTAQRPDLTKPAAGYPTMDDVKPVTLYRAHPDHGMQNHHPVVSFSGGKLVAAWSNAYLYEDTAGLRTMAAISDDGETWTPFFILFPSLGEVADRNFPHKRGLSIYPAGPHPTTVEHQGRIYAFGQTNNSPIRYLCRRIYQDNRLGPACWIVGTASPSDGTMLPTIDEVDDPELQQDKEWLKAWLDHESRYSPARGDIPESADYGEISHDPIYIASDGTQMRVWRNYNGTHRIYVSWRQKEGEPWSLGVPTNIPDSPSGVAVGSLPDGTVYLLGNQVSAALDDPDMRPYREYFSYWTGMDTQPEHSFRDPLTLALSRDGFTFDRVWAIRWGCPRGRFWGEGTGYAYPSATVAFNKLWVLYSANKQDMEILGIPLDDLK